MKKKSLILLTALACCLLSVTHSFAQKKMTQEVIDQYGTKIFEAKKEVVFAAVKHALVSHGYDIDIENPGKGIIKTLRKDIGATFTGGTQARRNFRAYDATITETPDGKTKVALAPRIYIGEAEATEKRVWQLKGGAGEYKLWEGMFKDIQDQL